MRAAFSLAAAAAEATPPLRTLVRRCCATSGAASALIWIQWRQRQLAPRARDWRRRRRKIVGPIKASAAPGAWNPIFHFSSSFSRPFDRMKNTNVDFSLSSRASLSHSLSPSEALPRFSAGPRNCSPLGAPPLHNNTNNFASSRDNTLALTRAGPDSQSIQHRRTNTLEKHATRSTGPSKAEQRD